MAYPQLSFCSAEACLETVCDIQKQKFQMEEVEIATHSSCFQSLCVLPVVTMEAHPLKGEILTCFRYMGLTE